MIYLKTIKGTTTTLYRPIGDKTKWEETNAYRDPVDIVSGTITMDKFFTISQCRKAEKPKKVK
jgi:hypothetical protein